MENFSATDPSRQPLLVFCTAPDRETSERIAHRLVEKRLAACVSVLDGISSVFHWKGKIETEKETLLLIKTLREQIAAVQDQIEQLHPYEVPEVIAIPITKGSRHYLTWLFGELQADRG